MFKASHAALLWTDDTDNNRVPGSVSTAIFSLFSHSETTFEWDGVMKENFSSVFFFPLIINMTGMSLTEFASLTVKQQGTLYSSRHAGRHCGKRRWYREEVQPEAMLCFDGFARIRFVSTYTSRLHHIYILSRPFRAALENGGNFSRSRPIWI